MGRNRQGSKGKKINPRFWVFCEGKTEEAYTSFLRSKFRLPIEIIAKVVGNKIDERFIRNHKKGKPTHEKDQDFLMYDADIPEVLERLKKIKSAKILASNPSIELWFLLHYKNQTRHITTHDCVKELSNRNRNTYKKGVIDNKLQDRLHAKNYEACKKAKKTKLYANPSSNIHEFIKLLEDTKNKKYQ